MMEFQRSSTQPRKKIKIGDDTKHDVLEAECGDDFWNEAHEDMLLEIFIRFPDSRSAIRTASICQYWHSVISKNPTFFTQTFISHHHQHQHRYPFPYTIFFRKADEKPQFAGPQYFQPICKLFSDDEPVLANPNFLDFMPSPMVIRGSCNDLLLLSHGSRNSGDLYICNPFTKQYIQLPKIPTPNDLVYKYYVVGHALVCMPGPTFQFKVVEFKKDRFPDPVQGHAHRTIRPIMMFCSESRKWQMRRFHYPRPTTRYTINWLQAVACNGILYWLEFEHFGVNRVIFLDLFKDQCGAIDFPDDYSRDRHFARARIGILRVHGEEELRLLQLVLTDSKKSSVGLKVWKLSINHHEKEWVLVHHKSKLGKPYPKSFQALPFVHPTNGDAVFMVWGQKVFQYNLKETTSTCELIGKLQEPLAMLNVSSLAPKDHLLHFPLMHLFRPTEILMV